MHLNNLIDDSKEDEISCASCLNYLNDSESEEFVTALGLNYHIDCFRYVLQRDVTHTIFLHARLLMA
jgi:hypothetical protein